MTETLNVQFISPEDGARLAAEQQALAHGLAEPANTAELGTEADQSLSELQKSPTELATPEHKASANDTERGFTVRDKRSSNHSDLGVTKRVIAPNAAAAKKSSAQTEKPTGTSESAPELAEKAQYRARRLKDVEAREELHKSMDPARWETRMKGKPHADSEALKRKWAEEDAADLKSKSQVAANGRIEEIIAAKKFQLGSRTIERADLANEIYKDAIAQAAREGHDVSHLFEDDDQETYHGRHRLDDKRPDYIPEEAWKKLTDEEKNEYAESEASRQQANELKRPSALSQEQWDELSGEEKRNLVAYEASLKSKTGTDEPEIGTGVAIDAEDTEPDKPSWKNPKERVLYLMRKAQANMWSLSSDSEKDHQRRKIAGGVAGGIAVAAIVGLAYLEVKGHSTGHHHSANNGNHPVDNVGRNRGDGSSIGRSATSEKLHTVTLNRGSNPWEVSQHELVRHGVSHPTEAQIMAYDRKLGKANGYNWTEWLKRARHLRVGAKLKLPR